MRYALPKQKAVRHWRRPLSVGDVDIDTAEPMLQQAGCSPEEAEAIYRLTSLCTFEDPSVIPPAHQAEAIAVLENPLEHKQGRLPGRSVGEGLSAPGRKARGEVSGGAGGSLPGRLRF